MTIYTQSYALRRPGVGDVIAIRGGHPITASLSKGNGVYTAQLVFSEVQNPQVRQDSDWIALTDLDTSDETDVAVPLTATVIATRVTTVAAGIPRLSAVMTVTSSALAGLHQRRRHASGRQDDFGVAPPPLTPPFPPFTSEATNYDTADVNNSVGPWGQTDGRLGTVSFWFNQDVDELNNGFIFRLGSGGQIGFQFHKDHLKRAVMNLYVDGFPPKASMEMHSSQQLLLSGQWVHVMASWNYSFPANPVDNAVMFVDGVQQVDGVDFAVIAQDGTDADLAYASKGTLLRMGHDPGVIYLNACISNLYVNLDERVDLTDAGNRLLFYGPAGESVGHGADGSFPTGSQPFLYAPDGDFRANVGYGPQVFNESGTITVCASEPVGFVP